ARGRARHVVENVRGRGARVGIGRQCNLFVRDREGGLERDPVRLVEKGADRHDHRRICTQESHQAPRCRYWAMRTGTTLCPPPPAWSVRRKWARHALVPSGVPCDMTTFAVVVANAAEVVVPAQLLDPVLSTAVASVK